MKQKIEGGKKEMAFNNPSYDKSLSVRDRLGDFMGKYHVVLNGVVKHDPYVVAEVDGGGMCCQRHKVEILDFVDLLISNLLASERQRCVEKMKEYVNKETLAGGPDYTNFLNKEWIGKRNVLNKLEQIG